ncbi:MAG: Uma2 family endonuclease [Hydrogenophilaceae bacterium]|nr:Uma2 family endonuclease [Hydrogenophilaceae bacterium]
MNAPARKLMTAEEFLTWCLGQEGRWELVGGVPTCAMVGATRRHDAIVVNLIYRLRGRLAGGRCSPQTADQAVRTGVDSIRRPDVTVDCGPTADDALEASRPTAVFEVLSPSTRKTDRFRKLEEYKAIEGLAHVALIDPDKPIVLLYTRASESTWTHHEYQGLDASLPLTAVSADLPLAEIYEGLAFEPE